MPAGVTVIFFAEPVGGFLKYQIEIKEEVPPTLYLPAGICVKDKGVPAASHTTLLITESVSDVS